MKFGQLNLDRIRYYSSAVQILECKDLEDGGPTAQGVDIEDVYIERYTSTANNEEKLALHVKWSPVDNGKFFLASVILMPKKFAMPSTETS